MMERQSTAERVAAFKEAWDGQFPALVESRAGAVSIMRWAGGNDVIPEAAAKALAVIAERHQDRRFWPKLWEVKREYARIVGGSAPASRETSPCDFCKSTGITYVVVLQGRGTMGLVRRGDPIMPDESKGERLYRDAIACLCTFGRRVMYQMARSLPECDQEADINDRRRFVDRCRSRNLVWPMGCEVDQFIRQCQESGRQADDRQYDDETVWMDGVGAESGDDI